MVGVNQTRPIFNHDVCDGTASSDSDSSPVQTPIADGRLNRPTINCARTYHISELIDLPLLQQLMDSFYELTGIRHTLMDSDNNILCRNGWTEICLNFHRACPQTEKRCRMSNTYASQRLRFGSYTKIHCLNGLIDYATPVVVDGQHLATLYLGQVFNEPPDEDFFRQQAHDFGFDENAYIQALHKVPIIPDSEVQLIMRFYSHMAQLMASMGMERIRQLEAADLALKQSEERLRLVLEASHDGFWDFDLKNQSTYLSPRWAEMLGYSQQELEPCLETATTLMHPEDYPLVRQAAINHLSGASPFFEAEYRMLTKSGQWKWMLARGQVVSRDHNGKPLRAAGTCTDITARKEAENTLRSSEEKFSKVFHNSPIMMTLIDLSQGIFLDANQAFCDNLGYERYEIIGIPHNDIDIYVDAQIKDSLDQKLLKDGKVEGSEVRFRSRSGDVRQGLLWCHLIQLNGTKCRLASLIDITEQKRIEHEMSRLSELNLIGSMAASIGHEIRNPMTSVRGFLQLFREKYSEDIEFIDLMVEELDRANAIITEFLGMAKDKAVCFRPQSLNQVVLSLYPMLEAEANGKGMKIDLKLGHTPKLLIDQNEIRQVLVNLANNSLEAMTYGGILTIGTSVTNDDVVLYVKDQGPGIRPEIMDKIGTPFFTTKRNGTGLGLSICYSIAARHNARLVIKSNAQGTTFEMCFPNCSQSGSNS